MKRSVGEAPRRRGRPAGPTAEGIATRERLYRIAMKLVASRGYEATTLRDIAAKAGVSVGLLYRYFPSKRAVILAFYDQCSAEYAERAAELEPGPWADRFLRALRLSLEVLAPHRRTLSALAPVLVGATGEGLFSPATEFSQARVRKVFADAVAGAVDAPTADVTAALGRLLYLAQLAVLLGWLFDGSPRQRATHQLVDLLERLLPMLSVVVGLPMAREVLLAADTLVEEALFSGR